MKWYVLLVMFCTHWEISHSQIEMKEASDWKVIGQLKFGGITKAKMEYIAKDRDTTYMLFIKDVRDQPKDNYFSIVFNGIDNTYNKFYEVLKSFFLPENKKDKHYMKTFKLGNTNVNVQHKGLIGGKGIMLTTNDGYTYWSQNDIDKLFGKR